MDILYVPTSKPARIKKTFSHLDSFLQTTSSFDLTFNFLQSHDLIIPYQLCKTCKIPYELINSPQKAKKIFLQQNCLNSKNADYKIFKARLGVDGCVYRCKNCKIWASIREGSFLDEFPGFQIMEIVKYVFYYYARGWGIDDVLIENKGWY